MESIVAWRDLIKYPNLIDRMPIKTLELLDTLQELMPIFWDRDRLGTMLTWLRNSQEAGLIDYMDKDAIITEMIHGCGGM